ncbi:hypothetical protein LINPERHAP2_LOCUS5171 [Linum perenne]
MRITDLATAGSRKLSTGRNNTAENRQILSTDQDMAVSRSLVTVKAWSKAGGLNRSMKAAAPNTGGVSRDMERRKVKKAMGGVRRRLSMVLVVVIGGVKRATRSLLTKGARMTTTKKRSRPAASMVVAVMMKILI